VRPLDFAQDVDGILAEGGTILGTHNKADPFHDFGADGADVSGEAWPTCASWASTRWWPSAATARCRSRTASHSWACRWSACPRRSTTTWPSPSAPSASTARWRWWPRRSTACATTARSHGRVMIAETMGRYAGWIALEGGMAGGADVILIPELPFDPYEVWRAAAASARRRRLHADLHRRRRACRGRQDDGARTLSDSPDPLRLGGVGEHCSSSCSRC
jgi:ATP-dependent phosphofructokinase / diphosphate-dependent phosphofructokinase